MGISFDTTRFGVSHVQPKAGLTEKQPVQSTLFSGIDTFHSQRSQQPTFGNVKANQARLEDFPPDHRIQRRTISFNWENTPWDKLPYGATPIAEVGNRLRVFFKVWAPAASPGSKVMLVKIQPPDPKIEKTKQALVAGILNDLKQEQSHQTEFIEKILTELKRSTSAPQKKESLLKIFPTLWADKALEPQKESLIEEIIGFDAQHRPELIAETIKNNWEWLSTEIVRNKVMTRFIHKSASNDLLEIPEKTRKWIYNLISKIPNQLMRFHLDQIRRSKVIPIMPEYMPTSEQIDIVKESEMTALGDGNFYTAQTLEPEARYMFRVNGSLLPDPYSRSQPQDVHGPSAIVNSRFQWTDQDWKTPADSRQLITYGAHIGTFTPEGTIDALTSKIDYIKNDVEANAILLNPLNEFPGDRNWGYDQVFWYAVENNYGTTDQLKAFINTCHVKGIPVILDIVYNHIGPDGNYFRKFDDGYAVDQPYWMKDNPNESWGATFNWRNPRALKYVLDNVEYWLKEFHVDGFRFDMTQRIPDDVLLQIQRRARAVNSNAILIAEDGRQRNDLTAPDINPHLEADATGLGYDFQYNFLNHHSVKSNMLGQSHMDASTDIESLANVLESGFSEKAGYFTPKARELGKTFNFSDSHDEIGNHTGERPNTHVGLAPFLFGSLIKYLIPGMPYIFMGEERGSTSPFYFFISHLDKLALHNTIEGRKWAPQPICTRLENFTESKINWDEKDPRILAANHDLIQLRKKIPALWEGRGKWHHHGRVDFKVGRDYLDSQVLTLTRKGDEHPDSQVFMVLNRSDESYSNHSLGQYKIKFPAGTWKEVFNTDSPKYGGQGQTNPHLVFSLQGTEKQAINLPPWGVLIFEKQ